MDDGAEQTVAWSFEDLISGNVERQVDGHADDKRAYLVADLDHTPPRLVPLDNELLVGRSAAVGLEISDESVSRRHARIRRLPDGEFMLEDLGSTNGTLVNGVRRKECLLKAGDEIQFGKTKPFIVNFHSRAVDYLLEMQRVELETYWAAGTAITMRGLLDPLSGALEGLQALAAQGPAQPTALSSKLLELEQGMRQMQAYIDKMLEFSRCVGRERIPVNLSSLMHSEVNRADLPSDRRVKIVTEILPHQWTMGSEDLLSRAIQELFANAIDAMPKGGRLDVLVETIELDSHEAYSKPHLPAGTNLMVEISDTGTGMKYASRRLSKPFFTTKSEHQAIGFGLMIAHRIIGVHSGYLELHNREGGGTTCRVFLPWVEEPELAP